MSVCALKGGRERLAKSRRFGSTGSIPIAIGETVGYSGWALLCLTIFVAYLASLLFLQTVGPVVQVGITGKGRYVACL